MNELNCPICGQTLVNSWELWDMLELTVECCGGKWIVAMEADHDNYIFTLESTED